MTEMVCPKCKSKNCRLNGGSRGFCNACGYSGMAKFFYPPEEAEAIELDRLRRLNKELELENRRLTTESINSTMIKQMIGTAQSKLLTPDTPAFQIRRSPGGPQIIHGVPTLMLSDLHFGEVVFSEQVGGVNVYNTSIAKKRLARVVSGAVKLMRETLSPGMFGGMVCVLGGDMVDGAIHEELRETGDATVMESVITLHDELIPHLYALADEFGKVHVVCVAGNHGRMDKKPRIKNRQKLNFDWLLYHFIMRTVEQGKYADKITFSIPDGDDASYRIYNTRFLLTHGDKFTGGNGITGPLLPWMRGDMKTRKQYGAMGKPYDWLIMGHWHQLRYLEGIIVNGCLPGFNEYAMRMGFGFELPQQALFITHPTRGVTFREAIWADEPTRSVASPWVSVQK